VSTTIQTEYEGKMDVSYTGEGATDGQLGKDQKVVISGRSVRNMTTSTGGRVRDNSGDILMHELVGHAIPRMLNTPDTGNAVDNENKVRAELEAAGQSVGLRPRDAAHPEN